MTTTVYPNTKDERPPTKTKVDLTELAANAREAGAQAARSIAGARVARALRQPIRPRPLWERGDLFQEPVYAAGLELLEDEDADDAGDGA